MTCACALKCEMSKPALSRKRAPIGGSAASAAAPAWWRAGHKKLRSVRTAVKRMAWLMAPAWTSYQRTNPGKIGRPAASADVQFKGRRASDPNEKMAPDPAVQDEPLPASA